MNPLFIPTVLFDIFSLVPRPLHMFLQLTCRSWRDASIQTLTSQDALPYRVVTLSQSLTVILADMGAISCLQFIRFIPRVWSCDPESINSAIRRGHMDCFRWLAANGCKTDYDATVAAAEYGNVDNLTAVCDVLGVGVKDFIMGELTQQHDHAITEASRHGHEIMLQHLLNLNRSSNPQEAFCAAAGNGHLSCLQLLAEHKGKMRKVHMYGNACALASKGGHLECLKFLRSLHAEWSSEVCELAAAGGHFECLKYAHDEELRLTSTAAIQAASGGHQRCLEYLLVHKVRPNPLIASAAARNGHIECLKVARNFGCELVRDLCIVVARGNHVACLAYARENGAYWDERTADEAATAGSYECLQYALDHGCPVGPTIMSLAARVGSVMCMRLLASRGIQCAPCTAYNAALGGHLRCLRFAMMEQTKDEKAQAEAQQEAKAATGSFVTNNSSVIAGILTSDSVPCLQFYIENGGVLPPNMDMMVMMYGSKACKAYLDQSQPR
eukprot:TRINITY_DN30937_c0_g1_i1.p1 TRINITY_DN30937_c0_g1~~TRINITY_DN30937_c0_g1_i1.p1  ORF type:complete len:509 (-),score=55.44 TRINITY_DN30937_c0_g1_i1:28-1524(-)